MGIVKDCVGWMVLIHAEEKAIDQKPKSALNVEFGR
jgi:hypothetical protein